MRRTPRGVPATPTPTLSLEQLERRLDIVTRLHSPWQRYGDWLCLGCGNAHPCATLRAARGESVKMPGVPT